MRHWGRATAIGLMGLTWYFLWGNEGTRAASRPERPLSHAVYFTLHDGTAAGRSRMTDACKRHLSKIPGVVSLAVGPIVDDLRRPLNDRGFDVALIMTFRSRDAHDRYQTSAEHQALIAETRDLVKQVRIFDAEVEELLAGTKPPGAK